MLQQQLATLQQQFHALRVQHDLVLTRCDPRHLSQHSSETGHEADSSPQTENTITATHFTDAFKQMPEESEPSTCTSSIMLPTSKGTIADISPVKLGRCSSSATTFSRKASSANTSYRSSLSEQAFLKHLSRSQKAREERKEEHAMRITASRREAWPYNESLDTSSCRRAGRAVFGPSLRSPVKSRGSPTAKVLRTPFPVHNARAQPPATLKKVPKSNAAVSPVVSDINNTMILECVSCNGASPTKDCLQHTMRFQDLSSRFDELDVNHDGFIDRRGWELGQK